MCVSTKHLSHQRIIVNSSYSGVEHIQKISTSLNSIYITQLCGRCGQEILISNTPHDEASSSVNRNHQLGTEANFVSKYWVLQFREKEQGALSRLQGNLRELTWITFEWNFYVARLSRAIEFADRTIWYVIFRIYPMTAGSHSATLQHTRELTKTHTHIHHLLMASFGNDAFKFMQLNHKTLV